jgi:hypothetical protein
LTKFIQKNQITIITLIIEHIFIVNLLEDINVDIIFYKFRQTEESLSCLKPRIFFLSTEGLGKYTLLHAERFQTHNMQMPADSSTVHVH